MTPERDRVKAGLLKLVRKGQAPEAHPAVRARAPVHAKIVAIGLVEVCSLLRVAVIVLRDRAVRSLVFVGAVRCNEDGGHHGKRAEGRERSSHRRVTSLQAQI